MKIIAYDPFKPGVTLDASPPLEFLLDTALDIGPPLDRTAAA